MSEPESWGAKFLESWEAQFLVCPACNTAMLPMTEGTGNLTKFGFYCSKCHKVHLLPRTAVFQLIYREFRAYYRSYNTPFETR